jgi:hypothetical protein
VCDLATATQKLGIMLLVLNSECSQETERDGMFHLQLLTVSEYNVSFSDNKNLTHILTLIFRENLF